MRKMLPLLAAWIIFAGTAVCLAAETAPVAQADKDAEAPKKAELPPPRPEPLPPPKSEAPLPAPPAPAVPAPADCGCGCANGGEHCVVHCDIHNLVRFFTYCPVKCHGCCSHGCACGPREVYPYFLCTPIPCAHVGNGLYIGQGIPPDHIGPCGPWTMPACANCAGHPSCPSCGN